ncbi:MAG: helix-turn-helix domain-containing protein [Lachnospiraceae bacterium]|nr:helix-turn-helix domain-containing protein [Lachnospiraceae bacterium]
MQHIDKIQESLNYIEENLQVEFGVEELADMAGYSLFHYYRVFQKLVGLPVMQYITRRKLLHAVYEIANGRKVIEVALDYGFETNAGFYKAFQREFQCSPSEYVMMHAVKHPYKIKLIQEEHIMLNYKKLKEVLTQWNMQEEPVTDFYYAGSGERSDCEWNVGASHVIKVSANIVRLEQHIKITKALASAGFGVALPVKTLQGQDYYKEGELCYCIEKKLEGKPIESSSFYADNPEFSARYLGEVLGQLDNLLATFEEEMVCNEPDWLESIRNWALPKVKEIAGLSEDFCKSYVEAFTDLYPYLPRQIIHRNPCPNNFVGGKDRVLGITDFELSEKNIRIFDACYMTTSILSENFKSSVEETEKWFGIFRDILTGYDSVVKLTEEEKKAVPHVVLGIQFNCIAYFSDYEKFRELAETNLAMLEWLLANREQLDVF